MFIVPWFWWRSLMNMFTVIHFLIHQRHCHKNRLVEDLTSTEHANIASLFVTRAIWMTFGCKKCHTFAYICIHLQYMHWNASIKLCPIEQNIQILKIKGTTYPWRSVSRHLMTAVCPKPNKSKKLKNLTTQLLLKPQVNRKKTLLVWNVGKTRPMRPIPSICYSL